MFSRLVLVFAFLAMLVVPSAFGQGIAPVTASAIRAGTALPSTCRVGQVYFKTAATVGLYQCIAANTWGSPFTGASQVGAGLAVTDGVLSVDEAVTPKKGTCPGASTPATPTTGYIVGDYCVNVTPSPDEFELCVVDNGSACTTWLALSTVSGGAPTDATYITQTANGSLSQEQPLGALSTGCLGVTTTTGVVNSRTITGTTDQVDVANGACGGNPTISLPVSSVPRLLLDRVLIQSEIIDLFPTGLEIITAQGANTKVRPTHVAYRLNGSGTSDYAAGGSLSIGLGSGAAVAYNASATMVAGIVTSANATNNASFALHGHSSGAQDSTVMNTGLFLLSSGADFTCADTCGTLRIQIWGVVEDWN